MRQAESVVDNCRSTGNLCSQSSVGSAIDHMSDKTTHHRRHPGYDSSEDGRQTCRVEAEVQ